MEKKELYIKLIKIQHKLKVAKNQYNRFGDYKYRSCEDILEAVKPLLDNIVLILEDEVINIGTKNYIKATAILSDGDNRITATAYAREAEVKKGMDDAQITGSASSYARKYALNGLFAIDDTKDSDTMDNTEKKLASPTKPAQDATTPEIVGKCTICGAVGQYHKPGCPNKK